MYHSFLTSGGLRGGSLSGSSSINRLGLSLCLHNSSKRRQFMLINCEVRLKVLGVDSKSTNNENSLLYVDQSTHLSLVSLVVCSCRWLCVDAVVAPGVNLSRTSLQSFVFNWSICLSTLEGNVVTISSKSFYNNKQT